jgi:hypothetical protein
VKKKEKKIDTMMKMGFAVHAHTNPQWNVFTIWENSQVCIDNFALRFPDERNNSNFTEVKLRTIFRTAIVYTSICKHKESLCEFLPRWTLKSSAEIIQQLITSNKLLITILKSKDPKTDPQRTPHHTTKFDEVCGLSPQANYTDRATAACQRS